MLKRLSTLALTLALAAPLASAKADVNYNVCGGTFSGFTYAFCASVQVSVTQNAAHTAYTVAMTVANLSGQNGSDPLAIFQEIGLDNISNTLASPANVTVMQDGSLLCTSCWDVAVNQGAAGGFNIDFLANTTSGNKFALSSCASGVPAQTTCADALHPVTISFDLTNNFDPSTADLYIKGQNGPNGQSTECDTGSRTEMCTNVTTTPEPATVGLMATGLFGLVPVFRRRRKGEPIEA